MKMRAAVLGQVGTYVQGRHSSRALKDAFGHSETQRLFEIITSRRNTARASNAKGRQKGQTPENHRGPALRQELVATGRE